MGAANIPKNEEARLRALYAYDLLDKNADAVFDRIIRIAADVCDVDISVIALIDRDRQYFLARNGMKPKETPRAIAFCAHAILDPYETFEIPDATKDPRFADNPLVTGEIGVRFYAAQPLTTADGYAIGGLCLIGREPKTLTDLQRRTLKDLGGVIMSLFESRREVIGTACLLRKAKSTAEMADEAIETQNDMLNVALANMSHGLAKFDADQCLIFCNERYAEIYGFPPELSKPGTHLRRFLEHRVKDGLHACEDPEAYIEKSIEKARGRTKREKVIHFADGRWVAYTSQPLPDGGWVSTHEDITERKKAELAVQRSQELFYKAFHANPALVAISAPEDGRHFDVNETWSKTLGYSREEAMAHSAVELGIWADPKARAQFVEQLTAEKSVRGFETMLRGKDGREIICLVSGEYLEVDGEPRILVVSDDITKRKEVEDLRQRQHRALQQRDQALRTQNERFNTALDNMSQGLCMFDADQCVIVCNQRYLSIYGLTRDQVKPGTSLRQIIDYRIANGYYAGASPEEYIRERLDWVDIGQREYKTQMLSDGRAIAITHQPMSGGGWVTTHEDITKTKRSTEMLRATVESFPGGISIFDRDLVLAAVNGKFYDVLDIPEDRFPVGCRFEDIARYNVERGEYGPGEADEMVRERLALAKKFEEHFFERRRPDGTVLEVRGFPLPQGGFVSTYVDVTERNKSEKALMESEARLRAVFDHSPACLNLKDIDGRFLFANKGYEEWWGLPAEQVIGKKACEFLRDDLRVDALTAAEKKVMATGQACETEAVVKRPQDDTARNRLLIKFPVKMPDESLLGIGTFAVDITERKKAEALNVRLARIVEDSLNEVFVFDAETLIFLQVNASACRNTGYTASELADMTPLDLKPKFTRQRFEEKVAPLRRGEQNHIRFQTTHRRKDGSDYIADIVLQQIKSGDQTVFAAIIEDITDRKRSERELLRHRDHLQELVNDATAELKGKAEELKQALAKERELNEMQRQFVSMASHEFRTPLAVIDGSVQRLLRKKDALSAADLEDRANRIRAAVKTMTSLMESTLSSARMDAGKMEIEATECDLRGVLLEVCVRQLEINNKHKIICDLNGLPASVTADCRALDQVFTNLLSNAVKYSPDGPDITVTGWHDAENAYVSVQDRGLGIDEDDLGKIGDRFFRAKTSTGIAGTGIGLSLAKSLVELHSGRIQIASEKGEGSVFTVCLPIAGPGRLDTDAGVA